MLMANVFVKHKARGNSVHQMDFGKITCDSLFQVKTIPTKFERISATEKHHYKPSICQGRHSGEVECRQIIQIQTSQGF